jgi:hypothetical protein
LLPNAAGFCGSNRCANNGASRLPYFARCFKALVANQLRMTAFDSWPQASFRALRRRARLWRFAAPALPYFAAPCGDLQEADAPVCHGLAVSPNG